MARTKKQLQVSRPRLLKGYNTAVQPHSDDSGGEPKTLLSGRILRQKKPGLSLKEPETETESDEYDKAPRQRSGQLQVTSSPVRSPVRSATTFGKPRRVTRHTMSKDAHHQKRLNSNHETAQSKKVVRDKYANKSSVVDVITSASEGSEDLSSATDQSEEGFDTDSQDGVPKKQTTFKFDAQKAQRNKSKHGTATEGDHYTLYANAVVCKVPPCKNRVFKTERTFGNHVFKKHGLISTGTSVSLYALDSDDEQRRHLYNARRRKQPGAIVCTSYYDARGSMRARWRQAKYRMRANIFKRWVTKFEDNRFSHPRPIVGEEALLIIVLKYVMPSLGYHPWNSLLKTTEFNKVVDLISLCPTTASVGTWTDTLSKEVEADCHSHLSVNDLQAMKSATAVLGTIFKSAVSPSDSEQLRHALLAHRQNICEEAIAWLQTKKHAILWENNHGWSTYEKKAEEEYQAWKVKAKPNSCATTLPNLVQAYKAFSGCSDAEAKRQAATDSVWIDTSDDGAPPKERRAKPVARKRKFTPVTKLVSRKKKLEQHEPTNGTPTSRGPLSLTGDFNLQLGLAGGPNGDRPGKKQVPSIANV